MMHRSRTAYLMRTAALAAALGALGSCSPTKDATESAPSEAAKSSPNVTIKSYATMKDVPLIAPDGDEYRLSHFFDNIVVLCVFATFNKDCIAQIDELNALHRHISRAGMTVIGVALDKNGPEAVKQFQKIHPVAFPVFTNGAEIVRDLGGARKLPTTFVLLRGGSIFNKATGYKPTEYFEQQLIQIRTQRI